MMRRPNYRFYVAISLPLIIIAGYWLLSLAQGNSAQKKAPVKVNSKAKRPKPAVKKIPKTKEFTIAAVGDVMFDRRVKSAIEANGANWPFAKTASKLKAELSIANLETSLAAAGTPTKGKDVVFQGTPKGIDSLKYAGFNLVSMANNHALDYGLVSLKETRTRLKKHDIAFTGAGADKSEAYKPALIKIGDLDVGFLSFSDIIPFNSFPSEKSPGIALARDSTKVASKIKALSKKVDIVIVSFHWGIEYEDYPNGKQKELAVAAVDAGADLVIGHHPHVTQGIAIYKGRLIIYSLGNFVFDRFKTKTAQTFILRMNMNHKGEFSFVRIIPVFISASGQPAIVTGTEADSILARLKQISGKYSKLLKTDKDTFVIDNRKGNIK